MRRAVTVRHRAGDMREVRRWRHRRPSPRPCRSTRSRRSSPPGRSTIRPSSTRLRRRPARPPPAGRRPPHRRPGRCPAGRAPPQGPRPSGEPAPPRPAGPGRRLPGRRHHRVRRPRQGGQAHRRRGAAHPAHLRGRHRRTPRRRGHRRRRARRRRPGPRRRPRRRRRDHRPLRAPRDPHPRRGAAPGVDHRRHVDGALRQLGVRAEGAYLSVARSSSIGRTGLALDVRTERTVTFMADGRERTIRTNAATVREAVAEAGITLHGEDTTSVPPAQLPARRPDGHRDADHRLPRGARGAHPVRRATVRGRFALRGHGGRRARRAGRAPAGSRTRCGPSTASGRGRGRWTPKSSAHRSTGS